MKRPVGLMRALCAAALGLALAASGGGAFAQFDPLRKPLSPDKLEAARAEARRNLIALSTIKGPTTQDINAALEIDLPAGYAFVPANTAKIVMRGEGDSSGDVVGLIVPEWDAANPIEIHYAGGSHVADDGDKAASPNEWKTIYQRVLAGDGGARFGGFVGEPGYDGQKHRFTFAATLRAPDGSDVAAGSVFGAFQFGREGYVRVMAAADAPLDQRRLAIVTQALDSVHFKPGQAYEDFDATSAPASTRTVAEIVTPAGESTKPTSMRFAEWLDAWGLLTPFLIALGALVVAYVAYRAKASLASVRSILPTRAASGGGAAISRFDQLNKNKPT